MSQNFERYAWNYPWNKIDNRLIGDDSEEFLLESMKYRRISYRIIPVGDLDEYSKNMKLLIEDIEKQFVKEQLNIQFISSTNQQSGVPIDKSTRIKFFDNLKHFTIPLGRGKRDKYEWMEMVLDKCVDMKKTFRIMFHWLVASAVKVDKEIYRFSCRCRKHGLRLVQFPQVASTSSMLLHPVSAVERIR